MAKVIFHIDLNAFFASAEELLDPSLVGKPVAVSGLSRRSVVSTASYEARKFGVHSAMPIQEALSLCPQLIVIKGHHEYYEELSTQFIRMIREYTPLVEQASIDECYADMSEAIKKFAKPLDLAWEIQQNLFHNYRLKCSIGVAPNKFLAKMASDMKKPMGITVIRKQEVPTKLWPLSINEMFGIGKKTAPVLYEMGIATIGDLAKFNDIEKLRQVLGKNTQTIVDRANGISNDELTMNRDVKSVSQSTTFATDITEYTEISSMFRKLAKSISTKLKEEGKIGTTISITMRDYTFKTKVRSKSLSQPLQEADEIFENAIAIYDENQTGEPLRLIGIGISNLQNSTSQKIQMNLFEEIKTKNKTLEIIDELNRQLPKGSLIIASTLKQSKNKKN